MAKWRWADLSIHSENQPTFPAAGDPFAYGVGEPTGTFTNYTRSRFGDVTSARLEPNHAVYSIDRSRGSR
jgi:hypothetical protein